MAKFSFQDLNKDIRDLMHNEVLHDIAKRVFYYNSRFNANGRKIYLPALKEAIAHGDESTLQAALENGDNFNKYEAQGKKVSANAATTFAQSEFNKYYIRAVCAKAIEMKELNVEVYRAQPLSVKKHKSDQKIGVQVNAERLLKDLRSALGQPSTVLPEIANGLSVKLKTPLHADNENAEDTDTDNDASSEEHIEEDADSVSAH